MKHKVLLSSLVAALPIIAAAQEPQSIIVEIEAPGNIRIFQPAALDSLLCRPATMAGASETNTPDAAASQSRSGYRVQVFEDNNPHSARQNAENYNARMRSEFPHLRSYVSFNSPYWRVKVGDFRNRAEAESVLAELRQAFPSLAAYMRIVRDKINIFD